MSFKNNHFLHFLIVVIIISVLAAFLLYRQNAIAEESRNTNRLASARMIVIAIENYHDNFQKYPENLKEISDFLSPIPTDPQTKQLFPYTQTEAGYTLAVPQEGADTIFLKNH